MKKRTPVSKIMSNQLITVTQHETISEVVDIFKENHIHHLPVVSGDKIVGLISRSDVDKVTYFSGLGDDHVNTQVYNMVPLDQVMTTNLETISSDDQIKTAAEMLAQGDYHAIPVVENEKLVGIVTSTDIIQYLLTQF